MAKVFVLTSSGRAIYLTFRINSEGELMFHSQVLEEQKGVNEQLNH
jgi:hypothetical protein